MPYKAILVTHTHWDREWYRPVEEYRFRLIELMDRLLRILRTEPEYHSFWFDGQTVPLEDYAEVCPERMGEVEAAMRDGKIVIGPWYVLGDEWMPSGEACVRNLLIGRRLMARYGQRTRIGYAPDNFGHMEQLPQILSGFGIDNAMFMRGFRVEDIDQAETAWVGADGTAVKAYCMVGGYSSARGITDDPETIEDRLIQRMPDIKRASASGALLLMNGIDHALPTPSIKGVRAAIEARFPDVRVRHGSLAEFLQMIADHHKEGKPIRGEMRHFPGLDGTLSCRPDQKRLNRLLENRLAHYAEPLAVISGTLTRETPPGTLDRAWKLLVKCHPHDTITGCHSDPVAADTLARLRRGLEIAGMIEHLSLSKMLGRDPWLDMAKAPCWIAVYNPAPWRRDETLEVDIHLPEEAVSGDLKVVDQVGAEVPSRLLSVTPDAYRVYHEYKIPDNHEIQRAKLVFRAAGLPPGSLAWYRVEKREAQRVNLLEGTDQRRQGALADPPADSAVNVLDNGLVRVHVHTDGSFDLSDKATGMRLERLNSLQIEADRGDLYCFRPALNRQVGAAAEGTFTRTEWNALRQTVTVETTIGAEGRLLPARISVTLVAGKRRVETRVEIENACKDFRLQAAFPLPSTGHARAHTPFSLTPREPVPMRSVRLGLEDKEGPLVSVPQPMQYFVQFALQGGGEAAIMNRGLYEYTWETPERPCLTLMRAVGDISLPLRCYTAHSGQAQGTQRFEYAVVFAPEGGSLAREAFEYNLPPRALQVFRQPTVDAPEVELTNPHWMPSALKPREEGDGFVLRFWNASDEPQSGEARVGLPFRRAHRARLDETVLEEADAAEGVVRVESGPFEIVTLVFDV